MKCNAVRFLSRCSPWPAVRQRWAGVIAAVTFLAATSACNKESSDAVYPRLTMACNDRSAASVYVGQSVLLRASYGNGDLNLDLLKWAQVPASGGVVTLPESTVWIRDPDAEDTVGVGAYSAEGTAAAIAPGSSRIVMAYVGPQEYTPIFNPSFSSSCDIDVSVGTGSADGGYDKGGAGDCITHSDDSFSSADWDITRSAESGTNSFTAAQQPTGGNPGAYSETLITNHENSSLIVLHLKKSAAYDPSAQGALISIDARLDAAWTEPAPKTPNRQAAAALVIVQDGTVYWNERVFAGSNEGWKAHAATNLSAFVKFTGAGPSTPDFSSAGKSMQFGFLVAASHTTGVPTTTRYEGIDNWHFKVCR
jgi:hypothetical protein